LLLSCDDLETATLKVADFGFAKALVAEHGVAFTLVGSPKFMAPEIVKSQPYKSESDLWSIGAVLYEMACAQPVRSWSIDQYIEYQRTAQDHPAVDVSPLVALELPQQFIELVEGLLRVEPSERWTWSQFFECAWLADDQQVLASKPLLSLDHQLEQVANAKASNDDQEPNAWCHIL
jgi:serine/threonine-protein kinase ULK2